MYYSFEFTSGYELIINLYSYAINCIYVPFPLLLYSPLLPLLQYRSTSPPLASPCLSTPLLSQRKGSKLCNRFVLLLGLELFGLFGNQCVIIGSSSLTHCDHGGVRGGTRLDAQGKSQASICRHLGGSSIYVYHTYTI